MLLNPLEFCWRTIHGRSPKPSLRAARVTSSSVSSFLFPLCTVYRLDLRACNPSSTCVSNRTHTPMRSCSPVVGYKHKCFFSSSFPCPSRKRSTTKLSSIFWSASGYARCAKFLIFSANSSADSLRRLVCARSSARWASSLSGGSYLGHFSNIILIPCARTPDVRQRAARGSHMCLHAICLILSARTPGVRQRAVFWVGNLVSAHW